MTDVVRAEPAFYVATRGGWRDWWALLHPPYTLWNLSYVTIGSTLAPSLDLERLAVVLGAFFCGLGISAHALDELRGRPLGTKLPSRRLLVAAILGLLGSVALGALGVTELGFKLVPVIAFAIFAVLAYNLELFSGRLHNDVAFAAFWGAFPVLVGYFGQTGTIRITAVFAAAGAYWMSAAQRALSTQARFLRRKVAGVEALVRLYEGDPIEVGKQDLLAPYDTALKAMSVAMVAFAAAAVGARLWL